MNFSHAVKGQLTRLGAISGIQSQAETELGRKLLNEEEPFLLSSTSPNILLGQIQKVNINIYLLNQLQLIHIQYGYGYLKFLLFLSQRDGMSCDVSPDLTPRDGNCLLHGKHYFVCIHI